MMLLKEQKVIIELVQMQFLIHSKEKNPDKFLSFQKIFTKLNYNCPLVAVPSTYSSVREKELIKTALKLLFTQIKC